MIDRPDSDGGMTLPQALLLGTAGGLAAGTLEGVGVLVGHALGRYWWLGWETLWLSPVTNVLLFIGLAAALWLLTRAVPRALRLMLTVGGLGGAAALAPLELIPGLHEAAAIVVALAAGLRLALIARSHPNRVLRLARGFAIGLGSLAAGFAAIAALGNIRSGRASGESAAGRPNVLLVVLDTEGAAAMSLHGYPRPTTPVLERLARSSTVFDLAVSPAPWTLPAHASLFTGRYPHETGVDYRTALDDRFPTLAEALGDAGYATAAFVANLAYTQRAYGLGRGFDRYEDFSLSPEEFLVHSSLVRRVTNSEFFRRHTGFRDVVGRKRADRIAADFDAWRIKRTRPWFAFLNIWDAHEPYIPPAAQAAQFGVRNEDREFGQTAYLRRQANLWSWVRQRQPAKAQRAERNAYDASIAAADRVLGELLERLEADGTLDRTIVVITSDHGEHFGERGLFLHGNSLASELLRVPLIIRYPGRVPAGAWVHRPVGTQRLAATLLDLAGVDNRLGIPGRSLTSTWREDANDAAFGPILTSLTTAQGNTTFGVVLDSFEYLRGDTVETLERFPDAADPPLDLLRNPRFGAVRAAAGRALDSLLAASRAR